jgi:hypothetical protein
MRQGNGGGRLRGQETFRMSWMLPKTDQRVNLHPPADSYKMAAVIIYLLFNIVSNDL